MGLYFLHVYKFKDVQHAIIFAFKYLRAKFSFSLFLMWVFLLSYPKSTHIFGEYPQQGKDLNWFINVKKCNLIHIRWCMMPLFLFPNLTLKCEFCFLSSRPFKLQNFGTWLGVIPCCSGHLCFFFPTTINGKRHQQPDSFIQKPESPTSELSWAWHSKLGKLWMCSNWESWTHPSFCESTELSFISLVAPLFQ